MSNPGANRRLPESDQDAKYREVKEKIAALIKDNKLLAAEARELRQDRDYWRSIAQIGGRG